MEFLSSEKCSNCFKEASNKYKKCLHREFCSSNCYEQLGEDLVQDFYDFDSDLHLGPIIQKNKLINDVFGYCIYCLITGLKIKEPISNYLVKVNRYIFLYGIQDGLNRKTTILKTEEFKTNTKRCQCLNEICSNHKNLVQSYSQGVQIGLFIKSKEII